ncbi:hypothetical protein NONO_c59890 [Nocardia nova SH22a]|uniref:Putative exodeoxyribonuclease 8 PDDEXK-like domain-containing protein n=1 Tax=Nocardia nova SH22a TaxID=1415166 RepID=W5TN31_9NOCA|nr:PD-(D/E)XK nuclease-like domain-containing protein [Nocardia nova]AHH20765.1 hypothetical protein NONO_c59890 [Nocardia nova SH22a]
MTGVNDICNITDLDREICWHCKGQPAVPQPLVAAPTAPGLYPDLPEDVYHGDPNSLSSTGVRQLLKPGGPAKFRYSEPQHNDDFDIGIAAHTLLLGTGAGIVVVDAKTWQSSAAKAARAQARAEGKVPLLTAQYDATKAMVDAAMSRPEIAELFPGAPEGVAELSAYAIDPVTWVLLRARFDYIVFMSDRRVRVRDYKTAKDASPRGFERAAADHGYHIQFAHYVRVLEALGYVVEEFLFVAQEKTPPYLPSVHEFDTAALRSGQEEVTAGARIFAACRDRDEWPGYGSQTNQMSLPGWARKGW